LSYDEPLVAGVALILAIIASLIALGPWSAPYRLRTIAAVQRRFGKPVARAVWALVALAMFAASVSIVTGIRPAFAVSGNDVRSSR